MGAAALVARFVLELCMLAALSYWGFHEHNLAVGVAAPVLAATIWGLFVSPRARLAPGPAVALLIELALFAAATVALVAAGQTTLAVILAGSYAIDRAVLAVQNGSLSIDQ